MASTTSTTPLTSLSSSSFDSTKVGRPSAVTIPSQCVTLPPPVQVQQPQNRTRRTTTNNCRKIARDVAAMATGETPADVSAVELPEVFKTIQEAWDKVDDKYAVTSLGVAVIVGLWGSTGMISAIDRLPLVPGVLELVGIGYSGWFAYKNLIFKPDREALLRKIKNTYAEIIGSN